MTIDVAIEVVSDFVTESTIKGIIGLTHRQEHIMMDVKVFLFEIGFDDWHFDQTSLDFVIGEIFDGFSLRQKDSQCSKLTNWVEVSTVGKIYCFFKDRNFYNHTN